MSQRLRIESVTKLYGDFKAIDDVSLEIHEGEFFTLLGPSGCGKTTLLRMIAGFNSIEQGTIRVNDTVINPIPAHQRDIGMVFQNYAIFPHMSVFDNVAYGLKARKFPKSDIERKVMEVLGLIRIEQYRDRQPTQLSGGQQQRVALARAIAIEPRMLLMDEPLSNLDAKLRVEMRSVIKKLQRSLNITTIYVTHDQEEALAISDRIAVMNAGKVQQVGLPLKIYSRPFNKFVSEFIGTSNFLECTVNSDTDGTCVVDVFGQTRFPLRLAKRYSGRGLLAVRPEEATLTAAGRSGIQGSIVLATFIGDHMSYEVKLDNDQIIQVNEYKKDTDVLRNIGELVSVGLSVDKINLFTEDGSEALL
jgi:iron(III) transport system ATP-binding protein